jgi:tetratricopeptide (TPR) repeat protein
MAKIIKLAGKPAERFGYKRASRRGRRAKDSPGQLNLFGGKARILRLPSSLSMFESALLAHEKGDPTAASLYRGDHREALDCFSKSLQIDSSLFETHFNLGNLHFEMGNVEAAKVHYEVARSIDPEYPNLYFNLGLVLALADDVEGAIDALRKYLELASADEKKQVNELLRQLVETKSTR